MAWRPFVVESPGSVDKTNSPASDSDLPVSHSAADSANGVVPSRGDSEQLSPGAVYIQKVEGGFGNIKAFLQHSGMPTSLKGREGLAVYKDALMTLASEVCQSRDPVLLEVMQAASGKSYVTAIRRVPKPPTEAELDAEAARQAVATDAGEVF